jgi:hypothetical protein
MNVAPTLRQLIEGMPLGFDPAAARDAAAVVEFEAPGEAPPRCHLVVEPGACRFAPGPAPAPTVRVCTDGDTWSRLATGELDPATAMAAGRLSVSGDLNAFLEVRRCFRPVGALDVAGGPPGALRLPAMAWLAVAFAPWKVLWVGFAAGWPGAGAAAALAAIVLVAYRSTVGAVTFFEGASCIALTLLAALERLAPSGGAVRTAASLAALATVWSVAAAVRPLGLTGEYARWKYVPQLATTSLFRYPNLAITLVWASGFVVASITFLARGHALLGPTWAALVQAAIVAACSVFTAAQERGARGRRVDDIDGRMKRLRGAGWALAASSGLALAATLA